MKLISLYIENFGALNQYSLDFTDELTAITQPNGFGKTTLAEFIRAMFYGFPRKAKTLDKSKRQKYMPWNGGVFGGNLVFEEEGRRFRLERTFGAVPKADTFAVIDLQTGRKTDRFSAEIGTQLFGLDSDSFERSIYLPQLQEEGPLSTAAIQAKLSNLVEDSSDVGNYDKAVESLRSARSALIPYRGSGGTVAQTAARISGIQLRLDEALQQYEQLQQLQTDAMETEKNLEGLKEALTQAQQKLSAAQEAAVVAAQQRHYEELRCERDQISTQIGSLLTAYPAGFPALSDLSAADAAADRLAVLESRIAALPTDLQSPQLTVQERAYFEKRIPAREELDDCRRKCDAFAALQQQIQEKEPTLSAQMKEREILELRQTKASTAAISAAWTVASLGIVGAIILLVIKQLLFAGAALAIGIIAAVAALLLLRSGKQRHMQLLQQQAALDQQIETAQLEITMMHRSCEQYRTQIAQLLLEFGIDAAPQQYFAGLARLEYNLQLFETAKQWQSSRTQLEEEAAQHRTELDDFFARYGQEQGADVRTQLRQMRDDLHQLRMLTGRRQELADRMSQMKMYQNLPDMPSVTEEELRTMQQEERNLRDKQTTLTEALLRQKQQIQLLQNRTELIPQLRDELTRAQDQLAEGREKARMLDETMLFLQQARQSLSTAYLGTIRSSFEGYLAQLEEATGEKVFIDTELQVQLERMGQARDLAYFSTGMTDLVALCMRLALVDALFMEQQIFVILDDPFVNLDDSRTAQALKLLETLAQRRQILYLTCHSSRTL